MKVARIHRFGGPDAIVIDDIPRPAPAEDEVVIRTVAAGVGPWDALIREHKSAVDVPLPIILGTDLSGIVDSIGKGVTQFRPGDAVYGATNKNFCGAYAEYALAKAGMIARKPGSLNFVQAASVPVVAVTAWQMLFDHAQLKAGQSVLIHGAAGNVGAYAVQLAKMAKVRVCATASANDIDFVRVLGADQVIDFRSANFEDVTPKVDAVLDTVGGETQRRSFSVLKTGGILVSIVSPQPEPPRPDVKFVFFLVDVTTECLQKLSRMFDSDQLSSDVGTVLPLASAVKAHEMLAGLPHARGKIVLEM